MARAAAILPPVPMVDISATSPPTPAQLATLGTVLCLHRPGAASELGGWARARRVEVHRALDGDGMRESLLFFDADDACCWQLHLLPDSDFLAWDALVERYPLDRSPQAGLAERLWRGLAQRLWAGGWQASVLRFHAITPACTTIDGAAMLVASLAEISPLGADCARQIIRAHGIVPSAAFADGAPHPVPVPATDPNLSAGTMPPRDASARVRPFPPVFGEPA
ncbi:Hemin transport protein [Luteimonas sp. S4-F44]|uniref:Hemin transport protein n=1 Tax=Luteimonas sp. S4-F44 TaxID=2925842 RepID=UPI001F53710C|nr:Hemin transport protein [Luteimonas sp. S4-F44]UNK41726.1 Hemin transport protein [Luteimonas sp. S4-F44]